MKNGPNDPERLVSERKGRCGNDDDRPPVGDPEHRHDPGSLCPGKWEKAVSVVL